MATVVWLHGGACNGNTQSFLNAEEPTVIDLVTDFGIEVLYHHALVTDMGEQAKALLNSIINGERELDVLVVEGTIINGPNGTGRYDMFLGRPFKDWVADLAPKSFVTVGVGECASFGGVPSTAPNPSDSEGLQFRKAKRGGFLGESFTARSGLPVINIPGCPAHPDWISQILVALATGRTGDIALDEYQRPQTFFKSFTQTGCTRNQFFEWKQSPPEFGQGTRTGCLFYEHGCRGPVTHSSCNRILWNRQSSKTRSGQPCTGCTEPNWPHYDLAPGTVFKTQKVLGVVPRDVPKGTDPLSYTLHAAAARAAAPEWSKEDIFVV